MTTPSDSYRVPKWVPPDVASLIDELQDELGKAEVAANHRAQKPGWGHSLRLALQGQGAMEEPTDDRERARAARARAFLLRKRQAEEARRAARRAARSSDAAEEPDSSAASELGSATDHHADDSAR